MAAPSGRARRPRRPELRDGALEDRDAGPRQRASGRRRSRRARVWTRSQSSSRPIITVMTGPMSSTRQALRLATPQPPFDGLAGRHGLGAR